LESEERKKERKKEKAKIKEYLYLLDFGGKKK
jgi:hypothetical protein